MLNLSFEHVLGAIKAHVPRVGGDIPLPKYQMHVYFSSEGERSRFIIAESS